MHHGQARAAPPGAAVGDELMLAAERDNAGQRGEEVMGVTEFLIEGSFKGGGRGYVVARILDPAAQFVMASGTTLGGCPVERWFDMPRALDDDRRERKDVFGFCLKQSTDLTRLKIGDRVVLT
jgi:hypothetical protein